MANMGISFRHTLEEAVILETDGRYPGHVRSEFVMTVLEMGT